MVISNIPIARIKASSVYHSTHYVMKLATANLSFRIALRKPCRDRMHAASLDKRAAAVSSFP